MLNADRLPTIEATRVRLRWLTEADVPALYEIFSNPEVMRYWSSTPLVDMSAAAGLLAEIHDAFAAGTLYQWGIALKSDDSIIGTCTLAALNATHKRAELGYAIARRMWGRGYAGEATEAVVRFAFETLELHRIEADVDPRNDASRRCLARLGFREEGYLRERYHLYGEIQDAALYGLLRREWASLRTHEE